MKSVLTVSAFISFALLLGRLSGFFREMLLAARFGTTETADAAILILTLPDFMVGLLLVGGFNSALVPALKSLQGRMRQALLARVAFISVGMFAVLAVTFFLMPEIVVKPFAPQLDTEKLPGFANAFGLSLISLPLVAVIGVSTSYLNTVGRFVFPSFSVLVFNLVLCIFLASSGAGNMSLTGFAIAIVLAVSLRLGFQLMAMRETLIWPSMGAPVWPHGLAGKFVSGVLGYSVIVGASIVFRSLFALNGGGYLATFNFAQKLFELPAVLLVAPLVMILLPKLSALNISEREQFEWNSANGIVAALALGLIAASVGLVFMNTLVKVIYQRGSITSQNASQIATVARLLIVGLPFYAILQSSATSLNANGRPNAVMINAVFSLFCGVVFYLLLILAGYSFYAAPLGFVGFQLVGAILNIRSLSFSRKVTIFFLRSAAVLSLKALAAIVPFALAVFIFPGNHFWMPIAGILTSASFLTALMLPALRPLLAMQIDGR